MRLVRGPCSETQALAASDRVSQVRVRMDAAPSTYPAVRRRVPPPKKQRPGSARRRGRACGPSLYACAAFQVAVQFVHLTPVRQWGADATPAGRVRRSYSWGMPEETRITPKPNGPLVVQGPVKIVTPDGRELPVPPRKDGRPAEVVVLCRCGGSATKPFCDGTHKRNGFSDTPQASPAPTP